ncbi:MAG: hypothetical protein IKU47_08390 [Oscillospiraceae bacterium]|nr:hypothetical protein [Oscillospiraceae bacterium]
MARNTNKPEATVKEVVEAVEVAETTENVAETTENVAETTEKVPTPKVYIVESPVKNYCGVGAAGVHFANGKAEVHEGWVLEWYKGKGYKVTEIK